MADHKMDRIFVPPSTFGDVGSNKIRNFRITFPAPPSAGLFTFQLYVVCDSYISVYGQREIKMTIQPPTEVKVEDDISVSLFKLQLFRANCLLNQEPEEDSLAGQLAAMRGQPVKRIAGSDSDEEDDDTSDTEEEVEYESSDSDWDFLQFAL